MDSIDRFEKVKEQNRIRAKRYYENNQAKILERRAEQKKQFLEAVKCCEEQKKEEPPKQPKQTEQPKQKEQLNEVIKNENSQKFYDNNIKTLEHILGTNNFNKSLKDSKSVIYMIETAKQKKYADRVYSTNSKKAIYQSILKLADTLGIKLSKKARADYVNKFEIMNTTSHEQTKEKIQTEELIDFETYKKKVKDHFGETSKELIIVDLYELSGFRDNLNLEVVPSLLKDNTKNYIVVPSLKSINLKIVLNEYKTSNKYKQDIILIPKILSKEIRKYIEKNEIEYGDYLFGKNKLSSFIRQFNLKLGLNITINKLRQMRVSKILNNSPTIEDRVKLAHEMKHTTTTSDKYRRKNKEIIV